MKNKFKQMYFYAVFFLAVLIFSFSCSLFTTSLGKGMARDLNAYYKNASANQLIDVLTSPNSAVTQAEAVAILNALSSKPQSELLNLNSEQVNAVFNAAGTAIVPIKVITDSIPKDTSDLSKINTQDLFNSVINSIDSGVNTQALVTLLNNPASVNGANGDAVAIATVALMGSLVKESGKSYTDIETALKSANLDNSSTSVGDVSTALADSLGKEKSSEEIIALSNVLLAISGNAQGDYKNITDLPFNIKF